MCDFPERYSTEVARQILAERLGLFYDPMSQDWEWEIADPEKFDNWLAVYRDAVLSDDERFSLMEMLIQCIEDSCPRGSTHDEVESRSEWQAVAALLRADPRLHGSTIRYWAVFGADDPEERSWYPFPCERSGTP